MTEQQDPFIQNIQAACDVVNSDSRLKIGGKKHNELIGRVFPFKADSGEYILRIRLIRPIQTQSNASYEIGYLTRYLTGRDDLLINDMPYMYNLVMLGYKQGIRHGRKRAVTQLHSYLNGLDETLTKESTTHSMGE